MEGSVTYSSVRLTRSSPSPSGVMACQSRSPLNRTKVPGSVASRTSCGSAAGWPRKGWQTRRLEDRSMRPTSTV